VLAYTDFWERQDGGNYQLSSTIPFSADKQSAIVTIHADGTNRHNVKTFDPAKFGGIDGRLSEPQSVYYSIQPSSGSSSYGELEDGTYKDITTPIDDFYSKVYPTYIVSPGGNQVFWSEERDGKNAIFVGDANAGNKQELATASEFKPFGWLTDDYLLLQKSDSELYITTKDQLKNGTQPLKISDYHKVAASLYGYGSGYGGQ
jgi:hypothetical protein